MERKSLVLYVVLTIITCGLFGLYWFYAVAKTYEDAQLPGNVTTTAGVSLLLSIVTCGIYGMYCYYKWGAVTPELFAQYGKQGEDKSIMYLVLAIFNLTILNLCLIQNDVNNLTGNGNPPPNGPYGGNNGGYPPYTPYPPTPPSYQNPNMDPGFAAPAAPATPNYENSPMNPDFHEPAVPTTQPPCTPAPEPPFAPLTPPAPPTQAPPAPPAPPTPPAPPAYR